MSELEWKKKQFIRLLISYNDFKNAYDIANQIIRGNYQEIVETLDGSERLEAKRIWESLNCAMTIGYCRPFSGNDKNNSNAIPDLPQGVLKVLGRKEKEIHQSLIANRNKFIAHSDSEAINMELFYMKIDNKKMDLLIPLQNATRAPYLIEVVKVIREMSQKLMEEIFRRRQALEEELEEHIPIKVFGKDDFDFPFNSY